MLAIGLVTASCLLTFIIFFVENAYIDVFLLFFDVYCIYGFIVMHRKRQCYNRHIGLSESNGQLVEIMTIA